MSAVDPGFCGPAVVAHRATTEDIAVALCRRSFYAFVWKVFESLHAGGSDRFVPNWHVDFHPELSRVGA